MAIAFVSFGNGSGDSAATSLAGSAINAVVGNNIIGAYVYTTGATQETVTVADTAGNSYTMLTPVAHPTAPVWFHPFIARVTSANASNVVTASHSGSRSFRGIVYGQYSGVAASSPVDDEDFATRADADPQNPIVTPALTLSQSGAIIGLFTSYVTRTFTPGTDFTERYDSASYYPGLMDSIKTDGGSFTASTEPNVMADIVLIGVALRSDEDVVPDAFTFTDQTTVQPGTVRTSNTITVAGLGAAVSSPVSITGGEWQKNGGSWGSSVGTVVNGDTFAVRHTASSSDVTAVNTTLTIGGVSDTFTSTTGDSIPDSFSFTDQTAVAVGSVRTSNTITLSSLTTTTAVTITGGEYSKNGGVFTSAAGTAVNGDTFVVRHTASTAAETAVNTVLTVGGVSDTFTSTTDHFRWAASNSNNTNGSKTVTFSLGARVVGDVWIADILEVSNDVNSFGTTSIPGFTLLESVTAAGAFTKLTRLRRVCDGTEGATATATTNQGGSTYRMLGGIVAYVGIEAAQPEDGATLGQYNSTDSNDIVAPSRTPTVGSTYLVTGFAGTDGNVNIFGQTISSPGSMLERFEVIENNQSGFVVIADEVISGTGATGTRTATFTGAITRKSLTVSTLLRKIGSGPTVASVSVDDIINAAEQNFTIAGVNFGASQGGGTVSLRQGTVVIDLNVDSWSATAIVADAEFETVGDDLRFGPATLRVTRDDTVFTERAVTCLPRTGQLFGTCDTPNLNVLDRIDADPDAVAGDQYHVFGIGGVTTPAPVGLVINADQTYFYLPGFARLSFRARFWNFSTETWGADAVQDVSRSFSGVIQAGSATTGGTFAVQQIRSFFGQIQAAAATMLGAFVRNPTGTVIDPNPPPPPPGGGTGGSGQSTSIQSKVAIVNLAIVGKLGSQAIQSFNDNSKAAQLAGLLYDRILDQELSKHRWAFAIRRFQLVALATAQDTGPYEYAYGLPADWLTTLDVGPGTAALNTPWVRWSEIDPDDWAHEAVGIVSNFAPPLALRYVARVTDPTKYHPQFIEAFVCRLGMEMADPLTDSMEKWRKCGAMYRDAIKEAKRLNAIQNPPATLNNNDSWLIARQ